MNRLASLLCCLLAGGGLAAARLKRDAFTPQNVTVYGLRPINITELSDKDHGDLAGDLFFFFGDTLTQPFTGSVGCEVSCENNGGWGWGLWGGVVMITRACAGSVGCE